MGSLGKDWTNWEPIICISDDEMGEIFMKLQSKINRGFSNVRFDLGLTPFVMHPDGVMEKDVANISFTYKFKEVLSKRTHAKFKAQMVGYLHGWFHCYKMMVNTIWE